MLQTKIQYFGCSWHLLPPLPFDEKDPDNDDEERDHEKLQRADDVKLDHKGIGNRQKYHCQNEEEQSDDDEEDTPQPARLEVQ